MTDERLIRARQSLEGLSVADSLGGFFEFNTRYVSTVLKLRQLPSPVWHFTDDTNMALSIYSILRQFGEIQQDKLAWNFAKHFERTRGYGMGARALLTRLLAGADWRETSKAMFGNEGSFGNGGSMRVAPVGAYFADDLENVVKQARLSAEITHAHPEGIAGAIAVAVAAAVAWRLRDISPDEAKQQFIDLILPHVPESKVRKGIEVAKHLLPQTTVQQAVDLIGNGSRVSAQDTVPFTFWCASRWLDNYEEAFWQTVSGLGDADTNCAIVGGIVVMYTGVDAIPADWLRSREALPKWTFEEQDA
jgi:ADP-ribosylglycohydrolase